MEQKSGNNTTNDAGATTNDFTFAARGGYFLMDNLAVGLGLGYNLSTTTLDFDNTVEKDQTGITNIGLFARYYVPYSDNFAVFAELLVESGFGKVTSTTTTGNNTNTSERSINALGAGISPGFTYFFHKNIALDLNYGFLGYLSSSTTIEQPNGDYVKNSISSTGLRLDLSSIRLGISVFF